MLITIPMVIMVARLMARLLMVMVTEMPLVLVMPIAMVVIMAMRCSR